MKRGQTSIIIILLLFSCTHDKNQMNCENGLSLTRAQIDVVSTKSPHDQPRINFEICINNRSLEDTLRIYLDAFEESPRGSFFIIYNSDTCEIVNMYLSSEYSVIPMEQHKIFLNTRYCSWGRGERISQSFMEQIAREGELIYLTNTDTLYIKRAKSFDIQKSSK